MMAIRAIRLKSAFAVAQSQYGGMAKAGTRLSLPTAFEAHS